MTASYLVRFDDLCPTMNWTVWSSIEQALLRLDIRPIVAVVPDNQDPNLRVARADRGFWERVRDWQSWGWTIGIHGYQHRYVTNHSGLVGLNERSEFAGLAAIEQEEKLQRALEIFTREGVRADVWVAPSHSFDAITVKVLEKFGLRVISDGLALFPYSDGDGTVWIPQQLWRFRPMPVGTWTVCCHFNKWTANETEAFCQDLTDFRERIVNLSTVLEWYEGRRRSAADAVASRLMLAMIRSRRWVQRMRGSRRRDAGEERVPVR